MDIICGFFILAAVVIAAYSIRTFYKYLYIIQKDKKQDEYLTYLRTRSEASHTIVTVCACIGLITFILLLRWLLSI